jgi:O-antigen/teichoic acid export membrane protein
MTSIGRKIVSSTLWSGVEAWAREATVFMVFILLARILGPEPIGLAALAMSVPYILMIPVQHGIPQALVQRQDIEDIHLDSAFWFLLALGALLTGLIWLSAPLLALAFGDPVLTGLIQATSLMVLLASISSVPGAVLARRLNFRLYAFRTMISATIGAVIGLTLALMGYGVWSLVLMYIGRSVVEAVVILVGCGWAPRLRYSHRRCKELFAFAWPVFGQCILAVANTEVPKVTLGLFLGPVAVGIYTLARRPLDLLVNLLIVPLNHVALPSVAQIQTDTARIDRFFDAGVRLSAMICFPAFAGFGAIAPILIPFALGPEWVGAVIPIQILALYGMQRAIGDICGNVLIALGHAQVLFRLQMVNTILGVVLTSAAALISVSAVSAAIAICSFVYLANVLYQTRKAVKIDVGRPLEVMPALLLSTVAMVGFVTIWIHTVPGWMHALPQVAIGIAIGALSYLVVTGLLLRSELLLLWEIMRKVRQGGGAQQPAE